MLIIMPEEEGCGRIALYLNDNQFSGSYSVDGGSGGYGDGTDGTFFSPLPEPPTLYTPISCPDEGLGGPSEDDWAQYGRTLNKQPPLLWYVPYDQG